MNQRYGPLLGLVRRTWWVFLAVSALLGALALVNGIQWRSAEPVEVGRGAAGEAVTLSAGTSGSSNFVVFADGAPEDGMLCRSSDVDSVIASRIHGGGTVDYDGQAWRAIARVGEADAGDVVVCPAQGFGEILVLDERAGHFRLMTIAFGAGALGALIMTPVFYGVGRLARRP